MIREQIQFHIWPWSAIGCPRETANVDDREVVLPYYGSPVLSVPRGFKISMDARHENFLPLGCAYDHDRYQLYRVPHAMAASKYENRSEESVRIVISHDGERERMMIRCKGAVAGSLRDEGELQIAVLEWSSFFDFCVQQAPNRELPWARLESLMHTYAEKPEVQKRSLIVLIAEKMQQQIQELVNSARRMLVHERQLLPAIRAGEMDSGCLQWYFRQPGVTATQKASANRQRLLAMSRRETFNTLENRVLKDFLIRCLHECHQYVRVVCSGKRDTGYAKEVNRFGSMCSELLKRPVWQDVDEIESCVRPNYVLQSDTRYHRIWVLYQKLLRKQNEEDWMWAWQGRTWADICTLLLGTTLLAMAREKNGRLQISSLGSAGFDVLGEQAQGSRIVPGAEPGPFLLSYKNHFAVLELVHANQAPQHDIASALGCTGGTLFLVFKPVGKKMTARVIVTWPVHVISSMLKHDFKAIQTSAEQALAKQDMFVNKRYPVAILTGLVLADAFLQGEPDFNAGSTTHLARLAADPRLWTRNLEVLTLLLEDLCVTLLENGDG